MPLTRGKSSQFQGVTKKSKTADLFLRLIALYDPGPFFPSLPTFQGAEVPVLLFPTIQIAQARVWRNQEIPHSENLKASINDLCRSVLQNEEELAVSYVRAREEIALLIGLCEAAFRPIKAVELAMEKRMFPNLLYSRSQTWSPSLAVQELLKSDFEHQWQALEKELGKGWLLAAGAVPLPISHHPRLIAPWVAGVTIERWLVIKKASELDAEARAMELTAVLLGHEVRREEFRHWRSLCNQVEAKVGEKHMPLPAYLIALITERKRPSCDFRTTAEGHWTPGTLLVLLQLDQPSCEQFAQQLHRAWIPPEQRRKQLPSEKVLFNGRSLTEPSVIPQDNLFADEETIAKSIDSTCLSYICHLCKIAPLPPDEFWTHLEDHHQIPLKEIKLEFGRKEVRRAFTDSLLARWQED